MIALTTSVETPRKQFQTETTKSYNLPPKKIIFHASQQRTPTPNARFQCLYTLPVPGPPPMGFVWKPMWEACAGESRCFSSRRNTTTKTGT